MTTDLHQTAGGTTPIAEREPARDLRPNAAEIAEHLQWLHPHNTRFELRCVGRGCKPSTWIGSDFGFALTWGAGNSERGNCYVTLNPVPDGVTGSATDADITARRNLLIDIDPLRPTADVNATDAEKGCAAQVADVVSGYLAAKGWPAPLRVDSGNGYHLIYAIDLPADDDRIKRLLHGLGERFDSSGATVDRKVFNASRITKLAGTIVSKAANPAADRPARVARLLDVPAREVVPTALLDAAIADLPQPAEPPCKPQPTPDAAVPAGGAGVWLQRARKYMLSIDPAVSGKAANANTGRHGHDQTFHAACCLVGFGLSPDEALPLFLEWNQRCSPPWTEAELRKKLRDADAKPGVRGHLQRELYSAGPRASWDNPQAIAGRVLRDHTIRQLGGTCYRYADDKWAEMSDAEFRAVVQDACRDAADAEYRRLGDERVKLTAEYGKAVETKESRAHEIKKQLDKTPPAVLPKVTTQLTANVRAEVSSRCLLPAGTEMNTWIKGTGLGYRLRLANGLLDPATGELHPHSADWFSLTSLPVAYSKDAACPKWAALVDELMEGDAERVAVVREIFGACLDPTFDVQFFAGFIGPGGNGKSVVLNVLAALLGPANVSSTGLEELSTNRFASWSLFGKLANIAADQPYFSSSDEGRLRALTGGDTVTFERKGRDAISAKATTRILFAANSAPTFGDKTDATWRRAVLIPFTYRVPADRMDRRMTRGEYWQPELPGILNWALAGLARLRAAGWFTKSAACEAVKAKLKLDSSPALEFLTERYQTGDGGFVPAGDCFDAYSRFCSVNGYTRPLTARKFAEEVKRAFPGVANESRKHGGKSVRGWVGLTDTEATTDTTLRPRFGTVKRDAEVLV